MCRASTPKPPPVLPEAPQVPTQVGSASAETAASRRRRGSMGTLLTGPGGTTNATSGGLTLLGRTAASAAGLTSGSVM